MHESLIAYIKSHSTTPLTKKEEELIKNTFVPKKIRKRQYFLQEGEVCKYMAFVVKGAMRQYTVDDKGAEHIVRLSIENWWVGDRESFIICLHTPFSSGSIFLQRIKRNRHNIFRYRQTKCRKNNWLIPADG